MIEHEAKNEILERIRKGKPTPHPLPELPRQVWSDDPIEAFISHLIGFDGRAIKFGARDQAIAWLKEQPELDQASNQVYSSATGITGNVTDNDVADLRNAHKISTCVTEGKMGVGEMGAIWVTDSSLKHAACALLARRLYILLDSKRIIGGLQEAYERIKLRECQYGSFYTGPSATADIEAVHITGAQGPLSLTALLYNCADAPASPALIINPNADSSKWSDNEDS